MRDISIRTRKVVAREKDVGGGGVTITTLVSRKVTSVLRK